MVHPDSIPTTRQAGNTKGNGNGNAKHPSRHPPQKAARHAARHLPPHERQHGEARPQRVAPRRVRVAYGRVQKEVSQPPPPDVLVLGRHVREVQPPRRHPPALGLGTDVGLARGGEAQKPEHTAGHALQHAHPGVEDGGVDLVCLVEVAKDERPLRQAVLRAGRRLLSLLLLLAMPPAFRCCCSCCCSCCYCGLFVLQHLAG